MRKLESFFKNKRILITGHSGFKGSWLMRWLEIFGSKTFGLSLIPNTKNNHFDLLFSRKDKRNFWVDIRDYREVQKVLKNIKPEIIFHLAAQPSVIESYKFPIDTFETNIIGTANLLNSAKKAGSVKSFVVVTSDKCYENKEWTIPYRETDRLGGFDPYSSSKACAELIANSLRNTFRLEKNKIQISSTRAGNVIGGGDWTSDRLIVDLVEAIKKNKSFILRHPQSTRPWQHVLDPLFGYLLLAKKNYESSKYSESWNFGPNINANLTTKKIVEKFFKKWKKTKIIEKNIYPNNYEAQSLMVDSTKSNLRLNWKSNIFIDEAIDLTIQWYRSFYEKKIVITDSQIEYFMSKQ